MIRLISSCLLATVLALSFQSDASGLYCDGDCGKWEHVTSEGEFSPLPLGIPYRSCFERAADHYGLPASFLAAVGSGESAGR